MSKTPRFLETPRALAVALCLAGASLSHAADVFAPPGTKATLSVDYIYESAGKKRSEGMYDPYEWRVKRNMSLTAELAAQPATAMPTVQAIDASQMAELKGTTAKMQSMHQQMAPMMGDVQKVMDTVCSSSPARLASCAASWWTAA